MSEDNREYSAETTPKAAARGTSHSTPDKQAGKAATASANARQQQIDNILDRGAFTHLLTTAQQSGLVSNTDAIIGVRDREFRAGKYQRASDIIQELYAHMNVKIAERQAALRREEMQYRSGALKMTPKEWMQRQRRETEKTQRIERARRQFARVLDGLNVLRSMSLE